MLKKALLALFFQFNIKIYDKRGLYDPIFYSGFYGAGFIYQFGIKSNDIINKALNILTRLEHRGAVSSDGRTGDGAGILIDIPHNFLKKFVN